MPTTEDRAAFDLALGGTMLSQMHLIRAFEEKVLELAGQGLVHGPAHSAIGQEGGAVGSAVSMRPSDQINGSHRAPSVSGKGARLCCAEGHRPQGGFRSGYPYAGAAHAGRNSGAFAGLLPWPWRLHASALG
ncbi:hypothetical protein VXQ18_17255 [Brucella abortus]|nr:hypothetical protein [Brucella abortus]